jgi:nucleoside-diphosphate-sugar epimerase
VVFTSTATVYGRSPRLPVNELRPTSICSDYDQHKIDFELSLREGADQAWFGLTILRLPNIYGSFVDRTSSDRGVLERWIKDAASGRPLVSYGGGNFLRDYLHVKDLCDLMNKIGDFDTQATEIFNPGTGQGVTIREIQEIIVKEVFRQLGVSSKVLDEPFPSDSLLIDQRDYVADVGKTRDFFGWRAKRSVRDEIASMVGAL